MGARKWQLLYIGEQKGESYGNTQKEKILGIDVTSAKTLSWEPIYSMQETRRLESLQCCE